MNEPEITLKTFVKNYDDALARCLGRKYANLVFKLKEPEPVNPMTEGSSREGMSLLSIKAMLLTVTKCVFRPKLFRRVREYNIKFSFQEFLDHWNESEIKEQFLKQARALDGMNRLEQAGSSLEFMTTFWDSAEFVVMDKSHKELRNHFMVAPDCVVESLVREVGKKVEESQGVDKAAKSG